MQVGLGGHRVDVRKTVKEEEGIVTKGSESTEGRGKGALNGGKRVI